MNRPVVTTVNAQENLLKSGWSSQTVQGRVVEQTGHFFILTSRATILNGEETVASIANSTAVLCEVKGDRGTNYTVICGATAEIWSSQQVAVSDTSENTVDLPTWFKSGRIGFERQNVFFDPRVPIWFYSDVGFSFSPGVS